MIFPNLKDLFKLLSFEWEDEPSKPLTDTEYYNFFGEMRVSTPEEIKIYDSMEIHRKDYGDFAYFGKCLDNLLLAVENTSKESKIMQAVPKKILPLDSENVQDYIDRVNKKILKVKFYFFDKIWDPGLSLGSVYYDDYDGIAKKFFLVEYNLCSDGNPYMHACGNSMLSLNLSVPQKRYEEGLFVRIHGVLPENDKAYFGLATSCTESFIEEEKILRKNIIH